VNAICDLTIRDPVNLDAARVLWRAPWWAKVSIPDRPLVESAALNFKAEDFVNVTMGPPESVEDKRGTRIVWFSGTWGTITGFCQIRPYFHNGISNSKFFGKRQKILIRKHRFWWALSDRGYITQVRWGCPSSRGFRTHEEYQSDPSWLDRQTHE
jgi:hypothetical protein